MQTCRLEQHMTLCEDLSMASEAPAPAPPTVEAWGVALSVSQRSTWEGRNGFCWCPCCCCSFPHPISGPGVDRERMARLDDGQYLNLSKLIWFRHWPNSQENAENGNEAYEADIEPEVWTNIQYLVSQKKPGNCSWTAGTSSWCACRISRSWRGGD